MLNDEATCMDEMLQDGVLAKTVPAQRRYMRYKEASTYYGVGVSKMVEMAREARAVRKVGKLTLVNLDVMNRYLESFDEKGERQDV